MLTDDKKRNGDDQKSQFQSKAAIILSDNDETDDDFDSLAGTVRAYSSSHQHDEKVSVVEPASVNDSSNDQQCKPSFFTSTSPQSVSTFISSPAAINSQSSSSRAGISLQSPASNTKKTGTVLCACCIVNNRSQFIYSFY